MRGKKNRTQLRPSGCSGQHEIFKSDVSPTATHQIQFFMVSFNVKDDWKERI